MKVCPKCNQGFTEADAEVCGYDGSRLVDTRRATRSAVTLRFGDLLGERYRIGHRLGSGAMGEVFAAEDAQLGRRVAVKVLAPDLAEDLALAKRFLLEVRAMARINHPHVVTIHDFGQSPDGLLYLVMEHLQGGTLEQLIRRGPLEAKRAVRLADQILDALESAHSEGIQHRDLKPENIFVTQRDGRDFIHVLDFGIAAVEGVDQTALTDTGVLCGTAEYIAPERIRGLPGDARSDLYAVGALLYEMLSGAPPFTGASKVEVLRQHLDAPAPRIGIESVDAVLSRALAKAPEARFGSALAMREALRGKSTPLPILRPERFEPGLRLGFVVGLGLAAAVLAATLYGLWPRKNEAVAPSGPPATKAAPVDHPPETPDAGRVARDATPGRPDAMPRPPDAEPVAERAPPKRPRRPRHTATKPTPAPDAAPPRRKRLVIDDIK